jgi:hypothetical protein
VHGDPGVTAIRTSHDETVLTVGSGHYAFSTSG